MNWQSVTKKGEETIRLYRLASGQGNLNSMQRLANCLDEGIYVEQNKEEAKRLYIEISKRVLEESKCI